MTNAPALAQAKEWIDEADLLLVAAGAGLSAAAGVDFGDQVRFSSMYPQLHRYGLRAEYQMIGNYKVPEAVRWGFWAKHVNFVRFGERSDDVYSGLLGLIGERGHFAFTSNVDWLFPRNGWSSERIFTPQGDYARMQCMVPCSAETWPTTGLLPGLLASTDPETLGIADESLIPRCPRCRGEVFFNVRQSAAFSEGPYVAQSQRFVNWLQEALRSQQRLTIIELGAGFNTPSVIRWPMESAALHNEQARLIRINTLHPEVPGEIADRSVGLSLNAADAVALLGD